METIYAPERFKASEVVKLTEYFQKYSKIISEEMNKANEFKNTEGKSTNLLGINIDSVHLKALEESCSLDHLLCEGEQKSKPKPVPTVHTLRSMVSGDLPFDQTFSGLHVLQKKAEIENYRDCEKLLAMNKENFHLCVVDKESEKRLPNNLQPGSDFVMNVVFYKPFKYAYQERNYARKCRFSHELQMLGDNTLTELRDLIVCTSDKGLQQEVDSPSADVSHLLNAKEEYPSGCFFIEGVFYNDMRSPKAIEYSQEFIKWGISRKVGNFTKADMHTTKLSDLSLRFGYPYVYCHQGDCEHIMVFSDAHILTENDCLNSHQYPRMYAINKNMHSVCHMCNAAASKWIIKDYERLPQSNACLCAKCAECYCEKDGQKLGEYKIYPIFANP